MNVAVSGATGFIGTALRDIEDSREHLLVIKTGADRYPALAAALEELHPYEVPELLALPIEAGSERYLSWLGASVSADSPERSG